MADDYEYAPLELHEDDGIDDHDFWPIDPANAVVVAERWRRQGRVLWFPGGAKWWGLEYVPVRLSLDDAVSINLAVWSRSSEPLDTSGFTPYAWTPHGFWKWRIVVEPANLPGMLYFVQNPSAPVGQGGSCMAEDLVDADGTLVNLPNPFSAPYPHWNFKGNLQLGYTDDAGTTVYWRDLIWN